MARSLLQLYSMRNAKPGILLQSYTRNIYACSPLRKDFLEYDSKYTSKEEETIFRFLNESDPSNILRLSMSQQRLKKIISQRNTKGNFISFSDILAVDGLGVKIMEKMCDSILNFDPNLTTEENVNSKRKIRGQILSPVVSRKKMDLLKSATAIYIRANIVAWTKIDKTGMNLTDWHYVNIDSEGKKKTELCDIVEIVKKSSFDVWNLFNKLPESDIYVLEAAPTILKSVGADANNPKSVNVNLQKAQLVAALSAAINVAKNIQQDESDDNNFNPLKHKVLFMRSTLSSRLFKTIIANEKISAEEAVTKILEKSKDYDLDCVNNLNISDDIKRFYCRQNDVCKEMLSQSLLLILTFYEVCVFENSKAVNKLYSF